MSRASSGWVSRNRPPPGAAPGDARLFSEVFDRTGPVLVAALARWLGRGPGTVLELGAGTGQNAAAFARAFPALRWIASDPVPEHRASIAAWGGHVRAPERPVLDLDAAADWAGEVAPFGPLSAVLATNLLHIAPPEVTEGLLSGAARALAPGGLVILAGPFRVHGDWLSAGNRDFDAALRAENPAWGLRDVADITARGAALGLGFAALEALPANNRMLVLQRTTGD